MKTTTTKNNHQGWWMDLLVLAAGALLGRYTYRRDLIAARASLASEVKDRVRLQNTLRARTNASKQHPMFAPIGTAHSAFSRRNGTPRQGGALVPTARCVVTLSAKLPKELLEGLQQYSHVWVIYIFHANTNILGSRKGGAVKGKVAVPRLDGGKLGVLATRSPHRPVPVGLSVGTVVDVDPSKGTLTIGGIDLVDGTPVLDIKPYVPFCDAIPGAFAPEWVGREATGGQREPLKISGVHIETEARGRLTQAYEEAVEKYGGEGERDRVPLYRTAEEFETFLKQVLSKSSRLMLATCAGCPGCGSSFLRRIRSTGFFFVRRPCARGRKPIIAAVTVLHNQRGTGSLMYG